MKLKKTICVVLSFVLSLVLVFAMAACGEKDNGPVAESVTLEPSTVTLGTGDTQRLTATVAMSDGTAGEVEEWTTSDETVATVTKGIVAAKKRGTATITAKAGDKSATCTVTVESIVVELSKTELTLERWTTGQLTASVKKNDEATQDTIDWTSSDDMIASVDATGKITAEGEGEAVITATRHGANQKATCKVTVNWTKPDGYKEITYFEQNKVPTNTWGYWNDPARYVDGVSEMHEAYYQSSADSDAGKVNFTFTVKERDNIKNTSSIIQITYRSAEGEGGNLKTNYDYKLSFEITSSVAGKIDVNTIGKNPAPESYDIVAGKNTIEVEFRHGDWGVIYPKENYTNVESAAFILLGLLGKEGEKVTVSIDKVKWTEIGESEQKTEKPDFTPAPVVIPDLSKVEAIALPIASSDESYTIASSDEGKSYNVKYSTQGETYANVVVDLAGTDADKCNTFAVSITNNGAEDMRIRFDINGENKHGDNNVLDIVGSSVAEGGTPSTNLLWGGTDVNVEAGKTVTLYLTYDATTENGKPTSLLIYFHTHVYQDGGNAHTGDVTLGGFKFASVTAEA